MPHSQRQIDRLFRLARVNRRAAAPALSPATTADVEQIARRAIRRLPSRNWPDRFERLCWWGAGAAAAACLTLMVVHPAAAEPDAMVMLVQWPADETVQF